MRTSKKRDTAYNAIKDAIQSYKYEAGSILPLEVDLAKEFGISRETLRGALTMLENENLIERVRGKGTFVSQNIARPKIIFFLPFLDAINTVSTFFQLYRGVLEQTSSCNCELETRVISKTNNLNDIDWKQLFKLDDNSNIIIHGFWFAKLFPILKEKKCNVVFIASDEFTELTEHSILSDWHKIFIDMKEIAKDITLELLKRGSKRPLFIMQNSFSAKNFLPFMNDFEKSLNSNNKFDYKAYNIENKFTTTSQPHIQYQAFLDTCKAYSPEIQPQLLVLENNITKEEEDKIISKALDKLNIDGVITKWHFEPKLFSNIAYGILNNNVFPELESGNYFYSKCKLHELGIEIVDTLINKDSKPMKKEVFPKVVFPQEIKQNEYFYNKQYYTNGELV